MRRYETWIKETQKDLREAIEACEEEGWHHLEASSDTRARIRIYDRLLTWETEITRRVEHYDAAKSRRKA